ncbi:MAG TPA: BamA/TamA family outer membrane protein [Longimicrobiales bacterium]
MIPTLRRLCGAAAASLTLLAAGAASARAQEPATAFDSLALHSGAEVQEVRFAGEQAIRAAQLASAIRTREEQCTLLAALCWLGFGVEEYYLDPEVVAADVLRLRLYYYERGYRQARVTPAVERVEDGVDVVFTIEEGEPVRVAGIALGGDAEPVAPVLKPATPLVEGAPLDLSLLQEARDTLQARLRDRGYAQAEVLAGYLIPTDSPHVARVSFDVYPGQPMVFGRVRVDYGANRDSSAVSPRIIRRLLTFRPGDVFRESEVVASQRQVYALELFTHVSIVAHPDSANGDSIPVTVSINIGDVHRVRTGVGINSLDCVNAEGRWISRSFMGGARRLEVGGRIANVLADELRYGDADLPCADAGTGIFGTLNGSVNVDFVQPWFLGPRNALGVGLGVERRSVPGVFVRDSRGGYVSFTHQLAPRTSATVGYRPALTSFLEGDDPFFCISFLACDDASVELLREPHWLAPLTVAFVHDASNAVFSPSDGFIVRLDGEIAASATGSAFQYARVAAEAASYIGLPGTFVLATHLRPGWAESLARAGGEQQLGLHPQRRFFAGGPNSVRGFAQSRLGPKILAVNGTELAEPVVDGGAGCVASDINDGSCDAQDVNPGVFDPRPTGGNLLLEGSVELRYPIWGPVRGVVFVDAGQVWNDEIDTGSLAWTPGLGVRYYSPIGPIRIDVGYNPTGAEVLPVRTTLVCVRVLDDQGDEVDCVDPAPGVYYPPNLLANTNELRSLDPVSWEPRGKWYDLDRFQIHFSIGQAF